MVKNTDESTYQSELAKQHQVYLRLANLIGLCDPSLRILTSLICKKKKPYPLSLDIFSRNQNPFNFQAMELESIDKTGIGINLLFWLESNYWLECNYCLESKSISFFALESEINIITAGRKRLGPTLQYVYFCRQLLMQVKPEHSPS